ncbi:MAG: Nitroreductase family protein [Parcubacteria group bacterium GW2011_GWA2_56_21]|nr:MAG: Nitroreductase family protein [Parcubacteria group bacterium GW2011_GWA2_56_21]
MTHRKARPTTKGALGQTGFFSVIRARRSVRKFLEKAIPGATVRKLWCPPSKKKYKADFLAEAPVILVVCVDSSRAHGRHFETGLIASAYLLLSVSALGLGSTFLTAYNVRKPAQAKELKKILHIPAPFVPISILPVGYPDEKPRSKKLRVLRDILHYDAF